MFRQAKADRQTDTRVSGTRVTDWEHVQIGWRNQRQYIYTFAFLLGFFLLHFRVQKCTYSQGSKASFSSHCLLVLTTANSGCEWHTVALTVQRHVRYMRHRVKVQTSLQTPPPRNSSTWILPSWKCTQALVTTTICVSWWIIKALSAALENIRSVIRVHAASRETSTFKECSLHYVSSALSGEISPVGKLVGGKVRQQRRKNEHTKETKLYRTLMTTLVEGMLFFFFF